MNDETQPTDALPAGTAAPGFELQAKPGESVSLADFRGRPLIMAYYPADWSPVCSDQMALYNQVLPEFQRYGAEIVGVSVEGVIRWSYVSPIDLNPGADGILSALEEMAAEAPA